MISTRRSSKGKFSPRRAWLFFALVALVPGHALAASSPLDTTFGARSGYVVTRFDTSGDYRLRAYLGQGIQTADGKIVGVGEFSWFGLETNFAAARYFADGRLDPSFGNGGKTVVPISKQGWWVVRPTGGSGPAGSVLLGGFLTPFVNIVSVEERLIVVRLDVRGRWDRTYGHNGIASVELPPAVEGSLQTPLGIVVSPDGSVRAAVVTSDATYHTQSLVLVGLTPTGAPDNSFGAHGISITPAPEAGYVGVIVQPTRRILVVGSTENGILAIRAFGARGLPDPSVGIGGLKLVKLGGLQQGFVVAPTSDGGFLVGLSPSTGYLDGHNVVVRFNADLTLDHAFGDNGVMTLPGIALWRILPRAGGVDAIIVTNAGGYFTAATGYVAHYSAKGVQTWRVDSLPQSPGIECLFAFGGKLVLGGEVSVPYTDSRGYQESTWAWAMYRLIG